MTAKPFIEWEVQLQSVVPARFRTPAEYIADQQSRHPPIYQTADGWSGLFRGALSFCPPIMRTRVAQGEIASGEVGELAPEVFVTEVGGGYAIEMYSGMMRLIYSAARAIMATDSGRFRKEVTSALSGSEAASKIAELFKNYKEQQIATAQAFPATDLQMGWADTIAQHAAVFLLMHELGHIYNEHSSWPRFLRKRFDERELESRADGTASGWIVSYVLAPRPDGPQRQMFYAGAEFGLRVRMAMETTGMQFANTHPPAGDRITALRTKLRSSAGSQTFYAIASTSLAFDQMWRSIERMLLNQPPRITVTLDDVLSSMGTMAKELLKAGGSVEGKPATMQIAFAPKETVHITMLNSARDYMQKVPPEIREAARERATDVFEYGTDEFYLLLALLNTV